MYLEYSKCVKFINFRQNRRGLNWQIIPNRFLKSRLLVEGFTVFESQNEEINVKEIMTVEILSNCLKSR